MKKDSQIPSDPSKAARQPGKGGSAVGPGKPDESVPSTGYGGTIYAAPGNVRKAKPVSPSPKSRGGLE
jgi:hypothetical protein